MFVLVHPEKCDHVFVGFGEFTRGDSKRDWISAIRDKIDRLEAQLTF